MRSQHIGYIRRFYRIGEVEEKGVLPPNQTGFRKKVGTIDNVYVLNYLINKQIERKGKLILVFMDLRAAFNSVDRKQISETMRRRDVREGLIRRCEEVLMETRSKGEGGGQARREFLDGEGSKARLPTESVHALACGRGGNVWEQGLGRS